MKAVVYERYGPPEVLQLKEVPKPVPKENEVLIRIRATTVTSGDRRVRSLDVPTGFKMISRLMFGVLRPRQRILGAELAGEVEAIGSAVTRFKVGDEVFALSGSAMGCYAEYKAMPENGPLALKPPNLTFEEAAALSFGGSTALYFFRRANLARGEEVLINGASGGVGTAAMQIAKHLGAEVTAVCSGANADMVRAVGADKVIDYTKEDFTRGGRTYDVIMDTAGTAPFARCKDSLKEGGRLLLVLGSLPAMLQAPLVSMTSGKKVIPGVAPERAEDLRMLADLAQSGQFKPVIDTTYPLEQIVEAHHYVDRGHKRGNVIISLDQV